MFGSKYKYIIMFHLIHSSGSEFLPNNTPYWQKKTACTVAGHVIPVFNEDINLVTRD